MAAAEAEGETPVLSLDRVWIDLSGQARLLPFGVSSEPHGPPMRAIPFLAAVMRAVLEGRTDAALLPPTARYGPWSRDATLL